MAVRAVGRAPKSWLQAEVYSPPILHETVGVTPQSQLSWESLIPGLSSSLW